MLGLSDLYWHGSPALHWLPFCLRVCVYVRVCVLWTWPRSEWMMLGSKPRNSGLWNFHNPDFYFFLFFWCSNLWNSGVVNFGCTLAPSSNTHPHTHTGVGEDKDANMCINTQFTNIQSAQRHVWLQTDIWMHTNTYGTLCSAPNSLMTLLWSCWNDLSSETHGGSYGSDCA